MTHWRTSLAHSLRWRLVALFLLFALAVTTVFLLGMRRVVGDGWESVARPILADYAERLAAEIGSPPDRDRAVALAARLPLSVRIEGPTLTLDTHPGRHGRFEVPYQAADGHLLRFGLAGLPERQRPRVFGWLTLALLLGLIAVAYGGVRRMLDPIAEIGAGAARFGRGEFGAPIPVRRNDELGDLAGRINGMADSLAQRLDAKRALLLAISHELRSPLTRARVNAELVADGTAKDALLRDLGQMRDLITDLLESERLSQGHAALQPQPLDLAAWVREAVAADALASGVVLDLDPAVGTVPADAARLRLALRNLVGNALRHAAQAAQPPVVSLRRLEGGRVELAVRDFGPGVDEPTLGRLAQAFYRPDSARTRDAGGVGLGLYLCRLVAEAHGGRLVITRAEPGLRAALVWPREPGLAAEAEVHPGGSIHGSSRRS